MISKDYNYAIIGASNNPEKYGHRVLRDLKGAGYKVVPINPNEEQILGLKVYKKVGDYPDNFDVAVFITQPEVTLKVLQEVKDKGITKVWMQPGSESTSAVEFCEENGIECMFNACIMVERRIHE